MLTWAVLVAAAALAAFPAAAAANNSVPLRIMPLGAFVTFGVGSTTGDSYRKDLRATLVAAGHAVKMVGSKRNGASFTDNEVEATPGFVLAQIAAAAHTAAPQFRPNLVLLDAGTNNCNNGGTVSDAGRNVSALVADLFKGSPGAAVVLATLLVNKEAKQDACRVEVNRQYSSLAADLSAAGARLVLVDMRGPDGPTTADLNDTRHPNDRGYQKMAVVWNRGIQEALAKGFVSPPADNGIPADGDTMAGNQGSVPVQQAQNGSQDGQASDNSTAGDSMARQGGAVSVHVGAGTSAFALVLACLFGFMVLL